MIDSQHHVSLNGVKYRLYESGGDDHYQTGYEPLRPPNSVVVQGTSRQDLFQSRPDVLLWSLTDWSGGEGQIKYASDASDRHAVLNNVDPFSRPGQLLAGPHIERTLDNVGATFNGTATTLVIFGKTGQLWAVDYETTTKNYWIWNNGTKQWGAANTIPTATGPSTRDGLDSDDQYLYYYDASAGHLYKFDGTTATKMNDTGLATTTGVVVRQLGDYVYLVQPSEGKAWEIVKTATGSTSFTEIDNWDPAISGNTDDHYGHVARGPDRLYILLGWQNGTAAVRELIPSTAAGTGYGKEIAVWKGIRASTVWYHNGMIFLSAWKVGDEKDTRVLLYVVPGGSYGTLGLIRDPLEESYSASPRGIDAGSGLETFYFTNNDQTGATKLYQVDSVSGGMAQVSETPADSLEAQAATTWEGEVFFSAFAILGNEYIYRAVDGEYYSGGYAWSPWHDMGLSDEKVLSSITLHCEKLPADWSIELAYLFDGASIAGLAGTYTTTNGTGTKYIVSTSGAPQTFRNMRVRIKMTYTGGGTPTTTPVINSVEVRAQLAKNTKRWNLLLDLQDDLAGSQQALPGNVKIDNIQALDALTVVEFQDGYINRTAGVFDTYDVVVDQATIVLDRSGEGYAQVILREVA